jgi:hypothetical protein
MCNRGKEWSEDLQRNDTLLDKKNIKVSVVESLSQAELDDAYHLAIFESEDVISKLVYGISADNPGMRDYLIDEISEALNELEIRHMGMERYAALMKRLMKRVHDDSHPRG